MLNKTEVARDPLTTSKIENIQTTNFLEQKLAE